jgi:putative phosphoesterase
LIRLEEAGATRRAADRGRDDRSVLVAVISDTHMPRGSRTLPGACLDLLRTSDLILHAGDVVTKGVLDELAALGPPLFAIHGNADEPALRTLLPAERVVDVGGASLAMVHDAGQATGRLARLRQRFPQADAVIFGHSHIPLHETADGFQIFNPGSPTERRRAPERTMGIARVGAGEVAFEHVPLG